MKSLPHVAATGLNARFSVTSTLLELAKTNFPHIVAMQKMALELSRRQNEMVAAMAKQWVGSSSPAAAAVEIVERSVDNLIQIQQHFLDLYTPARGEERSHATSSPALLDAAQTQALTTRMQ